MTITVEIKGKSADRFRAYAATKLLRKPSALDHHKRGEAGLAPLERGARIRYDGEQIAKEGAVEGETLTITPEKGTTITKVVFYRGPIEGEVVVGSVDVNAAGKIEITIVEPPAEEPVAPQIVDE